MGERFINSGDVRPSMFRVAAIQMDCDVGYRKKNLARAENFILEAAEADAKLIVLPELFATGAYNFNKDDHAELMYHTTTKFLIRLAKDNDIHIVGSFIEKRTNGRFNTTALCGPKGLLGTYHKVYLWRAEVPFVKRGNEFPVVETGLGRIGLMTCYDIAYPEAGRALGKKRAEIVASGSAFYTHNIWDISTKARAYENSFYHVAANRIGDDTGRPFCGGTRIVDPVGRTMAEVKDGEGIIFADLDLEKAAKVRKDVGFFQEK